MKKILAGLLFLAASSQAACPNLEGKYEYSSRFGHQEKMEIEQDKFKGHELYFFVNESPSDFQNQYIKTDGKTRRGLVADQFEYEYKAKCEKRKLILTLTRVGDPKITYQNEYYLDSKADLVMDINGTKHLAKKE